jgi:hypothetical protein
MESHGLVRRLMAFLRAWLGFHSCSTSLLCWTPHSQSGARRSDSVLHLLLRVREDVAQCLHVRRRCCQIRMWIDQPYQVPMAAWMDHYAIVLLM